MHFIYFPGKYIAWHMDQSKHFCEDLWFSCDLKSVFNAKRCHKKDTKNTPP